MKRVTFAVPGDLATRTGGYGYDRRIVAELRRLGWDVDVVRLGDAVLPRLRATAAEVPLVIDGLAFGTLADSAAALKDRPVVALVHHPLALESGLSARESDRLRTSERAALSWARRVVATSHTTAGILAADYDIPADRIDVVVPGTDGAPFTGAKAGTDVHLLAVGAVVARKGFDLLVEALAPLRSLPWHLTIAGDRGRDAAAVARLDRAIAQHALQDRVACLGLVSDARLAALYGETDLFVLASLYEGYGMAYAEAIAHGLPVIGTTGGAIPEVVPAGAGRLVPPGDVAALSAALRDVIAHRGVRHTLAAGARAAAAQLPRWEVSGARFAAVLGRLI